MIMAIDCGLSSVKIALARDDGLIELIEREPYPTLLDGAVAEQAPQDWWDALCAACARIPKHERKRIAMVVATGHMHATLLLDALGTPLRPCMTLYDRRGADMLSGLEPGEFHAATGEILDAPLPVANLMWLRAEEPSLLERAEALVAPKDYIRFRLTGTFGTDPIDAAGTGLYDATRQQWSSDVLERTGLPRAILPTVQSPLACAGGVAAGAAEALGVPEGAAVLVGAGDDIELLGASGYVQSEAAEHVGTTGAILRSLGSPLIDPNQRVELYPTAIAGTFAVGASLSNVGSIWRWISDQLDIDPSEALAEDPQPSDPVALPYLLAERVPTARAAGQAAIADVGPSHGRHELARAMLCSVALALGTCSRALKRSAAQLRSCVRVSGNETTGGRGFGRPRTGVHWRRSSTIRPHSDASRSECAPSTVREISAPSRLASRATRSGSIQTPRCARRWRRCACASTLFGLVLNPCRNPRVAEVTRKRRAIAGHASDTGRGSSANPLSRIGSLRRIEAAASRRGRSK